MNKSGSAVNNAIKWADTLSYAKEVEPSADHIGQEFLVKYFKNLACTLIMNIYTSCAAHE